MVLTAYNPTLNICTDVGNHWRYKTAKKSLSKYHTFVYLQINYTI